MTRTYCATCHCDPCQGRCPPAPRVPARERLRLWLLAVADTEARRRAVQVSRRRGADGSTISPDHRALNAADLALSRERDALDDMRAAFAEELGDPSMRA